MKSSRQRSSLRGILDNDVTKGNINDAEMTVVNKLIVFGSLRGEHDHEHHPSFTEDGAQGLVDHIKHFCFGSGASVHLNTAQQKEG